MVGSTMTTATMMAMPTLSTPSQSVQGSFSQLYVRHLNVPEVYSAVGN